MEGVMLMHGLCAMLIVLILIYAHKLFCMRVSPAIIKFYAHVL